MSEFYELRRNSITDISAFFGFLIGFLGSGPLAWPYLSVGFQTGEIVRGFTYFIGITFGSGVACGILGLAAGRGLGWLWERAHRYARQARADRSAAAATAGPVPAPRPAYAGAGTFGGGVPTAAPHAPPPTAARSADDGIRISSANVPTSAFGELLFRCTNQRQDPTRLAGALERTINVGAWEGDRLVGVVRVLTDGYRFAVVADLLVDPSYRHRGIGRSLMARVAEESPTGFVVVSPAPGSEAFFRRIGCEHAAGGFGLRWPSA